MRPEYFLNFLSTPRAHHSHSPGIRRGQGIEYECAGEPWGRRKDENKNVRKCVEQQTVEMV